MSVDIDVKHSIIDESQTVLKYGDNSNNNHKNNSLFLVVVVVFKIVSRSSHIVNKPDFVFSRNFNIFLPVSAGLK